jgi:hypothetical protein
MLILTAFSEKVNKEKGKPRKTFLEFLLRGQIPLTNRAFKVKLGDVGYRYKLEIV